ncbi:hypothetical protein H0H93_015059, partial [Arthromyces matolae]
MAKPSKRSAQAKRQRATGGAGFGSGYTDDPIDIVTDPNYTPEDTDSDEEWPSSGFSFSLADAAEKESVDGDDEDQDDLEMAIAHETTGVLDAKPLPKAKKPRLLTALPTYSGCSRSSRYKRDKDLREATVGYRKINEFFVIKDSDQTRRAAQTEDCDE